MPRGNARGVDNTNTNTYRVVVVAADEPEGAANRVLSYEKITVNVTDADELGVITLVGPAAPGKQASDGHFDR